MHSFSLEKTSLPALIFLKEISFFLTPPPILYLQIVFSFIVIFYEDANGCFHVEKWHSLVDQ